MYFSLEFVFKREIIARQKGDVSAMGLRGCTLPRWNYVLSVSLEEERKREVCGSDRDSYIDSSLISEVHIVCVYSVSFLS